MAEPQSPPDILKVYLDRLLASREPPKTICPSEVARALTSIELATVGVSSWRELMLDIRVMVAKMRDRGEVEVLQKGLVLEGDLGRSLEDIKGPIRVRRVV
jgi:Protein of unknown function (DUF3253)